MASLTQTLGTETYDDPQFPGSGPIDCIYVVGGQAGDFTLAKKSTETFGSDHFAVFTRFLFSGEAPKAALSTTGSLESKGGVWISALLPNREGRDEGNEWLTLKNGANEPVDLAGWQLRDEAGHTVGLNGVLATKHVWMREVNELTGGNVADEGVLRAEGDLEAAVASVTGQSRASNLRSGKKCQKIRQALDAGGGRDVKMGSDLGLERFQAQPKWEIPARRLYPARFPATTTTCRVSIMKLHQCCVALCGAFVLLASSVLLAAEHNYYVAPDGNDQESGLTRAEAFATPARAHEAVRDLLRQGPLDGPVTVYLASGVHALQQPLVFTPEDSGTAEFPITWTSSPGEVAVLSGGQAITSWTRHEGNIWKAKLPESANRWFRQLYVDGVARPRARTPNDGFHIVAGFPEGTSQSVHYHTDCKSFEYAPGDIDPTWKNLQDVEVIVYHFWTDSHLPIASIDSNKRIVTFTHRAGKVFTDDFTTKGARYIVEHVWEGLDQPGEWYLDRPAGTLYYIPLPGEDLSQVDVVAPVAPALVRMSGNCVAREYVEHIRFTNLAFRYVHFQLPRGNSNDRQGSASVPAAIVMKGARHCQVDHCEVSRTGTFAVELSDGCSHNEFTSNQMTALGAGGFRIDGGTQKDHPLKRTHSNVVAHNEIGPYGTEYPSAVGVLLMNTSGNRVAHNDIHHGGYTGVSVGWVWGYGRSVSRDNLVEYNHIHHIGQGLLSDMGGIYTLGLSPGTVLRNNHIHHVEANHYGGWGIYNDEGSSHMLITNNVVHDTKFAGYNIHYAKEVTVRNNIFAFGRLQQLSRSRIEPHQSVYFENNIVYWTEGPLLDKKWQDKEYSFYFHNKNSSGTRSQLKTFEMDYNLFFNPEKQLTEVDFNGQSWDEWRKRGNDRNSRYADPQFVDAPKRDFRLRADSPALALGFEPIDLSTVGPQGTVGPGE